MASITFEKSADELKHEIAELYRQQREITERLTHPRGRRGGRGGRGFGRGRGRIRQADRELEGQPPKKKLLSTIVKVNGSEEGPAATSDSTPADDRPLQHTGFGRRRELGFVGEPAPRVMPKVEDPNLVTRNRRMFGALLGTLEKFRQEDKALSGSEAYVRRTDAFKRAEQRTKEESDKLRQQERQQVTENRKRDLILKARVLAKTDEKQLELLFMKWTEHRQRLSTFLKTKAEPAVFYLPVKLSENDEKLLQDRQKEFEEWKLIRREEINVYQKQLSDTYLSNAEAEIEKWLVQRTGGGGGGGGAAAPAAAKAQEAGEGGGGGEGEGEGEGEGDGDGEGEGEGEAVKEDPDALVGDVMEEEDDYRPEDDASNDKVDV